jgi:xanthine dehydrogenase accessory factor
MHVKGGSAVSAALGHGAPFVAATVVRAQSPTSVSAGDSAIVRPDGAIEGFVGGTCAEASVRLYSLRAMDSGEPLLLRILPGGAEGEPEASEGAVTVKNPCLSGGALEVFLEPHLPPPTIRVVGVAPIAAALADLAKRMGYAVRSDPAEQAVPRPDDAAVVVASHGHDEERLLTEALRSGVPYVALVASEVRGRAIRESLDLPEEERARLHTPAGLEIGAETPEEIALAILAEIVALRPYGPAGRAPRPRSAGRETAEQVHPAEETSAEPAPARPAPAPAVISTETARDPMCGMEVAVSEASIQLERGGELYYFCSEGCRDTFSAEGVPDGAAH